MDLPILSRSKSGNNKDLTKFISHEQDWVEFYMLLIKTLLESIKSFVRMLIFFVYLASVYHLSKDVCSDEMSLSLHAWEWICYRFWKITLRSLSQNEGKRFSIKKGEITIVEASKTFIFGTKVKNWYNKNLFLLSENTRIENAHFLNTCPELIKTLKNGLSSKYGQIFR